MLGGAFEQEGAGKRVEEGQGFNRIRSHICRGLLYAWC